MAGILSIQFKPKIGDKQHNLEVAESFIQQNKDKNPDIILLPEFFSTGIDHNSFLNFPEDETGGKTIETVRNFAKKYNTNIAAGSVIEKSGGKLYNTCFIINRKGEIAAKYRKIHLFNYMGGTEGQRITPGNREIVVELDFAKIGAGICFDMRYPQFVRKLVQMGAEIIILPTAWCVPNHNCDIEYERDIWQAMNRVRAFDNLVYVASCNQIGVANERVQNIGCSMIVSPEGKVLANAEDKETAIYADIDLSIVKHFKEIYPISDIT